MANARISQVASETLIERDIDYHARISQVASETLIERDIDYHARISQVAIETLMTIIYPPGVDEYTKYLLRGDGVNGSTIILDDVYNPISVYGNTQISTAKAKFNKSSILFDGVGDYLRASSVNLSVGEMTLESQIYMNAMPTSDAWPTNWSSHMSIIGVGTPGQADGLSLILGETKLILQSNNNVILSGTHNISTHSWHHVAAARDENNDVYLWVDGQIIATINYPNAFGTGAYTYIGSETGEGAYFNGHMQEIVMLKGKARWKQNFTPPRNPYGTKNNRRHSIDAYGQYFGYWKYN